MKLLLAVLLFVGAALGNSTHRYAWQPRHEYQYRYESKIDFSIPEIRADQKSGLRLAAVLRVQAQNDFSLLIKATQPRFLTINGLAHEEVEAPIPAAFKTHLEAAFKVNLRKGVFEAMFVDAAEPVAVTNIKRAIVSNLNMDLSASRRTEVMSNEVEIGAEALFDHQSFFHVREQSLHGDCQTIYNIHPLATYEAMEIEEQLETIEKQRSLEEHLLGGLSLGRDICEGKKYWQITKTRDFKNCIERPVFQKWYGIQGHPTTGAHSESLMSHVSSSNYIVCGTDMTDFVIRKSLTENAITAMPAWTTDERFQTKAEIALELLKQETVTTPLVLPTTLVEIKHLIYHYPEASMTSSKPIELPEAVKSQVEAESGIRPILPMPDLVSPPKMLIPINLEKDDLIHRIVTEFERLSTAVYSTTGCPSEGDVAGHLNIIAKALRPLGLEDLKAVEANLEITIASLPVSQQKIVRTLFYDVVAMIGTNPAIMMVKEHLLDTTKISTVQAVSMIQTLVASVRTPTPALAKELINFVKVNLKPLAHERTMLYNMVLVQASNLIHRACIAPSRTVEFPVKVYGQFCSPTSEHVVSWIEFLKQELVTEQNQQIKLNIITSLGKLGHVKAVEILKPIITNIQYNEMVRSLAVHSLKRVAVLQPAVVRPILMSIIKNIAERPEVRIAAVAILPYAQPTVAELKMIAVRTWMEPSQQVNSFIYSTLKSLAVTEVPELKPVGLQIHSILSLVKPVALNLQYSQNLHFAKLVSYLEMIVHQEISWVASPESFIPARISANALILGQEYAIQGPAFTAYTRGMEKWIDLILKYTMKTQTSTQVQTQLTKITEELGITKKPVIAPEIFAQAGLFNADVTAYLNEPMIVEALASLADELNRDFATLIGKKAFEITKVLKPIEVEGLLPCDAGLPIYIERSLPMVVALKAETEMELEEVSAYRIPKILKAKIVPAINMKFEMNMGVISPFTEEIIGTGLTLGGHLTTPLEMTLSRKPNQIALDIKLPEDIQKELCMFHAAITPFNFKKSLTTLAPISKAVSLKPILTGEPLKKMNLNIGAPLDLDARVIGESDAKYVDIYSYLEKIIQQNPISLVHTVVLPSTIRRSSIRLNFNPLLSKSKEVSIVAGIIAKPTSEVLPSTEEMTRFCSKAMPKAMCKESLVKTLSAMAPQTPALALRLDAALVGSTKALNAAVTIGAKIESSTIKDIINLVTKVELTTHLAPMYEILMTTSADIPRVNILRNTEQLLQQALQVVLNGRVELGFVNEVKAVIGMKTLMTKTAQQIKAVRASPEFLACKQKEQIGRPLSDVCELIRHQAASVDEIHTELVIPDFLPKVPIIDLIVPNIVTIAKTIFTGHLIETPISHVSPTEIKMITRINRVGDEAQVIIEYNGRRYQLINIRIPISAGMKKNIGLDYPIGKGILPISLRTPFLFVGLNRLARIPTACHVAPTHVTTFDRKTYNYQMNNCFHLLFRDCTEKIPVAVMARNLEGVKKEVKILAGIAEVLLTPTATDMRINLNLNGQAQIVQVLPGEFKVIRHNGVQILHIQRFEDNVYAVHAVQENVMVLFCGEHAQIFGTPLFRGRSCGLCGDLNAETTADLKSPQRCLMSRPRFAAYSYMIQEPTCQGIPSQDLAKYNKEKQTCVRQEIIPTTL